MGLFNLFDPALNIVLGPLLKLPTIIGLLIISLIITLIITIIYKYTTDQELLKSIRDKQKKLQEEMRKHKNDPKKVMKLQKEAFSHSGDMMKESFKSMIYTFIPIIILFGWISVHFAFSPINLGEEFNVTVFLHKDATGTITTSVPSGVEIVSQDKISIDGKTQVQFTYRAEKKGVHDLSFVHNNQESTKKVVVETLNSEIKDSKMKEGLIDYVYGSNEGYLSDKEISLIKVDYERLTPFGKYGILGWHPGWLGTYIIFSILLSILIRKLMNVY